MTSGQPVNDEIIKQIKNVFNQLTQDFTAEIGPRWNIDFPGLDLSVDKVVISIEDLKVKIEETTNIITDIQTTEPSPGVAIKVQTTLTDLEDKMNSIIATLESKVGSDWKIKNVNSKKNIDVILLLIKQATESDSVINQQKIQMIIDQFNSLKVNGFRSLDWRPHSIQLSLHLKLQ